MTANTYIKFDLPRDGIEGPEFGPFEWVELTYSILRVSPDGEALALHDAESDDWFIGERITAIEGSRWALMGPNIESQPFSDITIYTTEVGK